MQLNNQHTKGLFFVLSMIFCVGVLLFGNHGWFSTLVSFSLSILFALFAKDAHNSIENIKDDMQSLLSERDFVLNQWLESINA